MNYPVDQSSLSLTDGYMFRITHIDNIKWIMSNGFHCSSSSRCDPAFTPIGNADLISKRNRRIVPVPPGGTLGDYVPFYFTPLSVMLLNIKSGYQGMKKTPMKDIVIFVTTYRGVQSAGVDCLFTNKHAYMMDADYYSDADDLDKIDWSILQRRDFRKSDPDDPDKCSRYQAEALVHRCLPIKAVGAIGCLDAAQKLRVDADCKATDCKLPVILRPGWYFT